MSKRRLEREFDALDEEILPELSADERCALFVEAAADGKDAWCDRLVETCPQPHRWSTDFRFAMGTYYARSIATQATYTLETTWLHYSYLERIHWLEIGLDSAHDGSPSDDRLEQTVDRVETIRTLFVRLYTTYHVHRRFAEEILGLELRTWLELHPDASFVLDAVEHCLAESPWDPSTSEWVIEELAAGGADLAEPPDRDQLVDEQFGHLVAVWEDLLETAEPG